MSDVTVKRLEEVDFYQGPNFIPGMKFRPAGRGLGISAWGMNVIEIEAGWERDPEHDHKKGGQEEVYVVLRGSATPRAGGERDLEAGSMMRGGPLKDRQVLPRT